MAQRSLDAQNLVITPPSPTSRRYESQSGNLAPGIACQMDDTLAGPTSAEEPVPNVNSGASALDQFDFGMASSFAFTQLDDSFTQRAYQLTHETEAWQGLFQNNSASPRYLARVTSPEDTSGHDPSLTGISSPSIARQAVFDRHPWKFPVATKYPSLNPLSPYLPGTFSASLVDGLLEAYLADVSDHVPIPSSPLLLSHLFRRCSILSLDKPRCCTPALLASMLLVAAHTTESPFFGFTPNVRSRLCAQLLHLTVRLLNGSMQRRSPTSPSHASGTFLDQPRNAYQRPERSSENIAASGSIRSYIDNIVTHIHIGLVNDAAELKPRGSHWWHTAFQLAKDYKLNRDARLLTEVLEAVEGTREPSSASTNNSTVESGMETRHNIPDAEHDTPIDVDHDAVIEHDPSDSVIATLEELEERQRVWWMLYVWDKQMALRYNSPLVLKDAECRNVFVLLSDTDWQSMPLSSCATGETLSLGLKITGPGRQKGIPHLCCDSSALGMLLPFMCILGQVMDLHHMRNHPRASEAQTNLLVEAFTANIQAQLSQAATSIDPSSPTSNTVQEAGGNSRINRHKRAANLQARFMFHSISALLGSRLDMPTMLNDETSYAASPAFETSLSHAVSAASSLQEIPLMDLDQYIKPPFFGILLFHGASIVYVAAALQKTTTSGAVVAACETYARALEAAVSNFHSESLVGFHDVKLL
ncbi:hypothetical protein BHE90_005257 [Fusarium euwallaceae]|uniref:Uncharacterized protein n=1 Tax=Fusarium euwallaceae TaxID=1147111 RepID=A0A430LX29_9HYPO|nr:hypothetical protein BHE90_005257 [Fusarium euwallaceae]